jgi:myo-inositol catabolism protein IolC
MRKKLLDKDQRLHMVLTSEDKKLLETLADEVGLSKSDIVRTALRNMKSFLETNERMGMLVDEAHGKEELFKIVRETNLIVKSFVEILRDVSKELCEYAIKGEKELEVREKIYKEKQKAIEEELKNILTNNTDIVK